MARPLWSSDKLRSLHAGSSAEVEHGITFLHPQEMGNQLRRFILDCDPALTKGSGSDDVSSADL